MIGIGSSVGAVAGAWIAEQFLFLGPFGLMLLSAGGTLLLERAVASPSTAARAGVGLGGASLAVEMFAWSDRHHGEPLAEAFHTPGREIQRLVATKEPQFVPLDHTPGVLGERLVETLYPLVAEGIANGLFIPNRASTLCSSCPYRRECVREYGGELDGAEEI